MFKWVCRIHTDTAIAPTGITGSTPHGICPVCNPSNDPAKTVPLAPTTKPVNGVPLAPTTKPVSG